MSSRCTICGRLPSEPHNQQTHDAHYRMWKAEAARVSAGRGTIQAEARQILAALDETRALGSKDLPDRVTALFDTEPTEHWTGSTALVPASSLICAWCGPTYDVSYTQPALFYHGGYGATQGRRTRFCACGAINVTSVTTLNPRRGIPPGR